jgi:hypothetical protein
VAVGERERHLELADRGTVLDGTELGTDAEQRAGVKLGQISFEHVVDSTTPSPTVANQFPLIHKGKMSHPRRRWSGYTRGSFRSLRSGDDRDAVAVAVAVAVAAVAVAVAHVGERRGLANVRWRSGLAPQARSRRASHN